MSKRFLAMLLALVMVFSLLPTGVIADSGSGTPAGGSTEPQTTAEQYTKYEAPLEQHDHLQDNDAHICEHCVAAGAADTTPVWIAWGANGETTLPIGPTEVNGVQEYHYYLKNGMTNVAAAELSAEVVLCLNGYTVEAKSGNRFYTMKSGAKLTVLDCTAHYEEPDPNVAYDTGYRAGKLSKAGNCGIMFDSSANSTTSLTWYDGIFSESSRGNSGAAIALQGSAKLYMYGGQISDCNATGSGNGGAIYTAANTEMVLENVSLVRNTAANAGGAISMSGTATLKNTLIAGNFAKSRSAIDGAGSARITLDNCEITGNHDTNTSGHYGAVYIPHSDATSGYLKIQGSTYIYGNTDGNNQQANVFLRNNSGKQPIVTVGDVGLADGAKIGVSFEGARATAEPKISALLGGKLNAAQAANYFVSDNPAYTFGVTNDYVQVNTTGGHTHANCPGCTLEACANAGGHTSVTYTALSGDVDGSTLNNGGNYYLTGDVTITTNVIALAGKTLNICLSGHKLTLNKRFEPTGAFKINITDCTASTKPVTGEYAAGTFGHTNGGTAFQIAYNNSNTGTINMYDGILTGCDRNGGLSVANIQGKATFNMFGGEISDNHTTGTQKGVIQVASSGNTATFNMYGGTIRNNDAAAGGGVFHLHSGKINLYGGTITDNSTAGNGGVVFGTKGTVNVAGTEISGNTATGHGGAIYLDAANASLTVDGSEINGNTATGTGGAIYSNGGAVTVKNNSKLNGNTGTAGAGAVYGKGAVLDIQNTEISGNSTSNTCGGVRASGGKILLTGCTIKENSAKNYSAVCGDGSSVQITLDDCTITGNTCTGVDGAVFTPHNGCPLTIKGKTYIYDNYNSYNKNDTTHTQGNVFLQNNSNPLVIKAENLEEGTKIGVRMNNERANASRYVSAALGNALTDEQVKTYFVSDSADYAAVRKDDKVYLQLGHTHCVCGTENCTDSSHEQIECKPLSGDISSLASGSYYLSANAKVTSDISLGDGADVKICLAGNTLTMAKRFNLTGNAKLTFTDCKAATDPATGAYTAGKITGATGSVFRTGDKATDVCTINLYSGIITGNSRQDYSAVGFVQGQSTFNMYGGAITDNHTTGTGSGNKGIITVASAKYSEGVKSTVNVYGGTISGNSSIGNGGVFYCTSGDINLKNATIGGNSSEGEGGVVYIGGGKLTVENCQISENAAASAGVIRANACAVTVTGSTIKDNEAKQASVYDGRGGAQLELNGCTIENNISTNKNEDKEHVSYGAIYIPNGGAGITLKGKTVIYNNKDGNGNQENVYLTKDSNATNPNHPMLTIGDSLAADSKIGITMPTGRISAQQNLSKALDGKLTEEQAKTYFISDVENFSVVLKADKLYLQSGHRHCVCGAEGCTEHGEWIDFIPLYQSNLSGGKLPASGNFYLAEDIKTTGSADILGTNVLNLCLHGKTIEANGKVGEASDRIFKLDGTATLNLTDCKGSGKLTGATGLGGAILFADSETATPVLNMYGGEITGNTGKGYGGAVQIQGNGTFNLYGGKLTGNKMSAIAQVDAEDKPVLGEDGNQKVTYGADENGGGAIYLYGGGKKIPTFNMYGGEISGNESLSATYLTKDGKEAVKGGKGGAIYIKTGKVNLYGGEISGNTAQEGGAIYNNAGTLIIKGCAISGNTAKVGGAIYLQTLSKMTLESGKLTGNTSAGSGGAIFARGEKTEITVNGGEISGNTANNGGGILMQSGPALTVNGGVISGNTATSAAGGIYASTNTKLTMNGGTISGNTASYGAGIHALRSTLVLVGGEITGNTAKGNGGGMQIEGAKLTLTGTKFTKNTAGGMGGAIYTNAAKADDKVYQPTLELSSVVITENTAASLGGGVYINTNVEKLTLSGDIQIFGNKAKETISNLHLAGKQIFELGTLGKEAKVGLTVPTAPRAVSGKASKDVSGCFFSDSDLRAVAYQGEAVWLIASAGHDHCVCTGEVESCKHDKLTWAAWDDPTSLPVSGSYYLIVDVKTSQNQSITGSDVLNLCLNGHTIEAAGSEEGTYKDRIFDLKGKGVLNLTDCKASGKLTGGTYGVILFESNAESTPVLNMYGGALTGNKGLVYGGAVLVQGGGTFNMYGGKITGNSLNGELVKDADGQIVLDEDGSQKRTGTAGGGGAIALYGAKTTFNMYGGEISDNECLSVTYLTKDGKETLAGGKGGAIYSTRGTINLYGGEISGNDAYQGGAIYAVVYSKLTMQGGTVSGNTSDHNGAGMFIDNSTAVISGGKITENVGGNLGGGLFISNNKAELTISGGEISKNQAYYGGGMLIQPNVKFTFTGGLVSENKADTAGGIYASTNVKFTMTGGTVTGNSSDNNGAGIYLLRNTLNMTGGEISGNTAGNQGGGLFSSGSTVNIDGGKISGNSAKIGGGIATSRVDGTVDGKKQTFYTTVNLISGEISDNASAGAGGGVLVQGVSTLNVKGGTVSGNTAKGNGGGVYCSYDCIMNMEDGLFTGNHADGTGGGVYMTEGEMTLSGGVIEKNTTAKQGAGVCTSHSKVTLSGVKIRNHSHKGVGAGYTGFNSDTVMTGGSITGNYTPKYGAGVYLQRGKFTMKGGSISYNTATETGGGIYAAGIKLSFYGGSMIGNKAETGTGGGALSTTRWNYTDKGVKKTDYTQVTVKGGTFSENYGRNGGAFLIQSQSEINISGGTFTKNEGPSSGGALYISTNCPYHITGGTFTENTTNVDGGAINFLNTQGILEDLGTLEISGNYAKRYGGGVNITGNKTDATIRNVKIHDNNSTGQGGGLAINTSAVVQLENCEIYNNASEAQGGGMYVGHAPVVVMKGGKIYNNTSKAAGGGFATECNNDITFENVVITGNKTETKGGGIYTRGSVHLINCEVTGNEATTDGGGIATGKLFGRGGEIGSGGRQKGLVIENTKVTNNICGGMGGGAHMNLGHWNTIIDSEFSGNVSGLEGSALWVTEDLKVSGLKATGNTSKNGGFAVYIAEGATDGQSYIRAILEMGGNMQVCDNEGGDMYLGAYNAIAQTAEGFGKDTKINITLDSGLLTNRVFGCYNYEGGNLVYTITYGDRSMTEPEYAEETVEETEPTEATEPENKGESTMLYAGVGAFAVVIVAIAVIVTVIGRKKKKAENTAEEVTNE